MGEDWHDFYLLVGGAAGALVGLLFVVASLTGGLDSQNSTRGASIYMTPTLFHFGIILGASALAMAPAVPPAASGAIVVALALAGLAYAAVVIVAIRFGRTAEPPHWSDVWCYGVAPSLMYLAVIGAGLGLAASARGAAYALAAALLGLMGIAIRNAWDLITWIAPRANSRG